MQQADKYIMDTERGIHQAALEDWHDVLSQLWTAYDKPIDADRMALYSKVLKKIPLGLLEKAIERVFGEHIYNSVPTVAEVWNAVHKELHNPQDLSRAMEHWQDARWDSIVYRFDGVSPETAGDRPQIGVNREYMDV
jgi:hypothetical protein